VRGAFRFVVVKLGQGLAAVIERFRTVKAGSQQQGFGEYVQHLLSPFLRACRSFA